MFANRPILTRLLASCLLMSVPVPGCAPREVANSPELYNVGTLEEVGELYRSAGARKKQPPTSKADLARNRDLFLGGYQALDRGEIIVYWGVSVSPGDETGKSDVVLAYKSDVPTNGGPVLLKNLTIKTMTAEQFQAAPKPPGPTSAKGAGGTS
jgi:hypothetical protein